MAPVAPAIDPPTRAPALSAALVPANPRPAAPIDCKVATVPPATTPPPAAMASADIIPAATLPEAMPPAVKPIAPTAPITAKGAATVAAAPTAIPKPLIHICLPVIVSGMHGPRCHVLLHESFSNTVQSCFLSLLDNFRPCTFDKITAPPSLDSLICQCSSPLIDSASATSPLLLELRYLLCLLENNVTSPSPALSNNHSCGSLFLGLERNTSIPPHSIRSPLEQMET
mmetsp:Transcript_3324/g.4488  ORF Transcript_3324/g.4488 Transcript_3324/m.4488 type:complete len:228 (-) Transcript_3324:1058-1741(-)